MQTKGIGVKWHPPSPLDIGEEDLHNLYEAAKHKMPYRVEIDASTKAFNPDTPGVGMKGPISEGGFSGLPPVIRPDLMQELRMSRTGSSSISSGRQWMRR